MSSIYYISNYCHSLADRGLNVQPSAVTKVEYITDALCDAGFYPILYSTAELKSDSHEMYHSLHLCYSDREIYYPAVIPRNNNFKIIVSKLLSILQLLFFLITKVKKNDNVLVYHALYITSIVKLFSYIKGFKIYVELEEIYNAAYRGSTRQIKNEIRTLVGVSGYIFVNNIISEKTGLYGPSAICYGNYLTSGNSCMKTSNTLERIHLVYAGVLGEDSMLAIEVAKCLPQRYHMHILGYGSDEVIKAHMKYINQDLGGNCAKISYDGCLFGEEYEAFLTKCDIAICPRKLENDYSDYTFPSKIMVYLSHNLRIVCTPIRCVQESSINDLISFSSNISPESIAEAILNISFEEEFNASAKLKQLHNTFVNDLKSLFI